MSTYAPGDYVKAEFRDDKSGESEWMWMKVDVCDDERRLVFGKLDNESVVHSYMYLGQELAVSYDNIREHMKPEQFGQ